MNQQQWNESLGAVLSSGERMTVICIRLGRDVEIHTPTSALERLRELAYEGSLPSASTDSWSWTEQGWMRDEDPWEGS